MPCAFVQCKRSLQQHTTSQLITSPETKLKTISSIAHKIYFRTKMSWGDRKMKQKSTIEIMKQVKAIQPCARTKFDKMRKAKDERKSENHFVFPKRSTHRCY